MPRPAGSETRYIPGLDGVRAIAVAAVVGYHLGAPWLPGGLLGVGVFFTLSGYLITTILITAWERIGNLDLRHFWLRRARRLLPALIMVLIVVLVATPVLDNDVLPERGIEALAAVFYVSNWVTIASDVSYFQRFSGPGPLDHLWSLAVEEQFYLLWPLVLLVLFKTLRGRFDRMAQVTLGLAAVSFLLMLLLATPGFDNSRAYQGTDPNTQALVLVHRSKDAGDQLPVVRVHSGCVTGDIFHSLRCDCYPQLQAAMDRIISSPTGVLVYLPYQEGRGIGLVNKIRAYALQDRGYDTVDANVAIGAPIEARDYDLAAHILFDLGYPEIRLLTNNPAKVEALREEGVDVIEQIPLIVKASPYNKRYLATKKERMAHKL